MAAPSSPDDRQSLDLDARGRRLRAALAAVLVKAPAAEVRLMHHELLDLWAGIGPIVLGMR
jgi:hypothetical protein